MYKFGASFNCTVDNTNDVGGAVDGDESIDFLSNDLDRLKAHMLEDGKAEGFTYCFIDHHAYVGRECDMGGEVVSVMVEVEDEDEDAVAVILKSPHCPTIVD